jgi:hypothetical protein
LKAEIVFSLLAISLLLISLSGVIYSVKAESTDFLSFSSGITLFSPVNTTYTSGNLMLNLTLYSAGGFGSIDSRISLTYSIDSGEKFAVHLNVSNPGMHLITNGAAQIRFSELSEGSHYLTLNLYAYNQRTYEPKFMSYVNTVYFTVNDGTPPTISDLSIENKTYNQGNLPLNFTVDKSTSWIGYDLDNQGNVTLQANTTLTGLTFGNHSIVIYANDTLGNMGKSEIINFIIKEPETLPIVAVEIAVLVVAVLGIGLLVYLKKHKRVRVL